MARYKYPDDIERPEFKNRRIKINVYEHFISKDAKAALKKAKELIGDFSNLIPSGNDTLNELKNNLKANSDARVRGNLINSIVLPLPNNFQDSQSHNWSTESGIIGTIGTSYTGNSVGSVISKLTRGKISGPDLSIDKAIGAVSNSFGTRKPIIDPGYFQNYTGSEPRQFATSFDLIPSNINEAENILNIIMKLKQYSSPTRQIGGVSLLAPYYFGIEFSNKYIGALVKVDRLVLKSVEVDYGADGAMQMTGDGIPKQITLSLSWQEVDLTTSNEYSHVPNVKETL